MRQSLHILMLTLSIFLSKYLVGQSNETSIALNDSSYLLLERTKFDTTGKVFEYYDGVFPFSINGRPIFGTDGRVPYYTLSKATLNYGKKEHNLQVDNMYDPWFGEKPSVSLCKFYEDGTEARLRCIFSDGAGTYGAEWLIIGQSSIRTILTRDDWILHNFFDETR